MLIGVSGQGRTFTKEFIQTLAKYCKRPLVFASSNPTSKAEYPDYCPHGIPQMSLTPAS